MAQLKPGTTIGGRNIVQELDSHMAENAELEQCIADLEQRIADLEAAIATMLGGAAE